MKRLPHVLLLAVLALGATACADDSEPDAGATGEPTPTPTSETTSAPTTEPTEPASTPTTVEPTTPTATPTPTPTAVPTPTVEPTPTQPPADPDAPPTTYAAAIARFDAKGQEPRELVRFETTTGIYCLLDSDFLVGCELPAGGIPDPDYCGEGPTDNVGRIVFGDGAPTAECNSDTIREPGARRARLDTVVASSATGIQCLVESIGVTCLDRADGQGFFLGKSQYAVFSQ